MRLRAEHDHEVGLAHHVVGERLRALARHVDAELGERLDRERVQRGAGIRARRRDGDRVARRLPHEGGRELGLAAVAGADEDDVRDALGHGSSGRDVARGWGVLLILADRHSPATRHRYSHRCTVVACPPSLRASTS